jgi:hypothetical protein
MGRPLAVCERDRIGTVSVHDLDLEGSVGVIGALEMLVRVKIKHRQAP